jgi:hypothetical protein
MGVDTIPFRFFLLTVLCRFSSTGTERGRVRLRGRRGARRYTLELARRWSCSREVHFVLTSSEAYTRASSDPGCLLARPDKGV